MVPLGTCSAPFILFIPKISHNNTSILIFLITKEKKSTHKILKSFFTWYIDLFEHVLEFATLNTFVFQVFKSTYTKMDGKRRSQKIILKKKEERKMEKKVLKTHLKYLMKPLPRTLESDKERKSKRHIYCNWFIIIFTLKLGSELKIKQYLYNGIDSRFW